MADTKRRKGEGMSIYERALPLEDFPDWKQEEIAYLVAQPAPPPRWIGDDMVQMPSRAWFEWHWQRGRYPFTNEKRPSLSPIIRQKVIDRDGYLCGLCGGAVEPCDVHIDHIHPYSLGGSDHIDNLQVSHSFCNSSKGNRV